MATLRADLSEVLALPGDFAQGVRRGTTLALQTIESYTIEEAPYREGNLQHSIGVAETPTGGAVFISGNAAYAKYVHQGTGIWGPHKKRIYPKSKKALYWPGAAHPVASVAGQKPNPFMDRAAERAAPEVEEILAEVLRSL